MKKDLFKKITVIGLALTLAFAMTACGDKGTTEGNDTDSQGQAVTTMTQELAQQMAIEDAGLTEADVQILESGMEEGKYEIEFLDKGNNIEYSYEISEDGKILEKESEPEGVPAEEVSKDFNQDAAVEKALKAAKVSKSEVAGLEADAEDGKFEVEFIKNSNGAEYSFEYDSNGKLLEKSVDYNRTPVTGEAKLSKNDAAAKAADFLGIDKEKVAAGSVYQETDDGEVVFEVNFDDGSFRYDVDINGTSGKVLEWSKERI